MKRFFDSIVRWIWTVWIAAAANADPVHLTLYHTSDIHENSTYVSRIAHFVKMRKQEDSNTLFFDTGDWFNKGDLTPLETKGEAIVAMLSACRYDGMILGNHEYSFGTVRLIELIDRYAIPLLCANCGWPEGASPETALPYNIFNLEGLRVAVIGMASTILNHRQDDLLQVDSNLDHIKNIVISLHNRADIVVLLTHLGEPRDLAIAKEIPRLDIILGGHDHKLYREMLYLDETQTIIHHSGAKGAFLGEVKLVWEDGHIVHRQARAIEPRMDMPVLDDVEIVRNYYVSRFKPEETPIESR